MQLAFLKWLIGALGIVALVLGFVIRARSEPTSVNWDGQRWHIERHEEREAIRVDFVRDGASTPDLSLHGSTDILCDAPWLALLDMDGDGRQDAYFRHCGGHGFVKNENGLVYVHVSSERVPPPLRSIFFEEIRQRGVRLIATGAVLSLVSLGGFLLAWYLRRKRLITLVQPVKP